MKDLAKLESQALTVDLSNATAEQIVVLRDARDAARQFLRSVDGLIEDISIAFIEQHGPIECGEMRYVVAADKSYKPRMDPAGMTRAFLNLHGGDMDKLVSYLSASAFRHGQLRKDLAEMRKPEMFDEFYETVVRKSVEGKPVKQVQQLNTKFVRSTSRTIAPVAGQE